MPHLRQLTLVAAATVLAALAAACSPGASGASGASGAAGTSGSSGASPSASTTAPTGVTTAPSTSPTSTSTPVPPSPTELIPEACASTLVSRMSAQERAGQLLMVGLDISAPRQSLDPLIRSLHLGGVIFLGGWYDGADVVRATAGHLASTAKQAGDPGLLLAADQEGGNVQQLRGDGFSRIPTALSQSRLGPEKLTSSAATWAAQLRSVGINVNLAPVADTVPLDLGSANAPIGQWDRQYSSDPAQVGRMASAFVRGMTKGGVAAAAKHFPGIGRITGNTDLTAQGITDSTTASTDPYLRPFAATIAAGADLVMVGSAIYSRIDPGVNATFSTRIVRDLLRRKLGFDGVVITDDVGAAKAVSATPVGERATKFVAAGGDVVLTARPATAPAMHDALLSRLRADRSFAAQVTASATRVLTLKVRLGLATCS